MEDMSAWDYVTACLYFGPLDKPEDLCRLLMHEALLADGSAETFAKVVRENSELIRGPSPALRIRNRLAASNLLLPRALEPDPHGVRAKEAWHSYREGLEG